MSARSYVVVALFGAGALSLVSVACSRSSAQTSATPPPKDVKELARRSLAEIDGSFKLPGLHQPVEVVRDEWGVPHIYAQNSDDLFFAQGYVMAQDRLWEMEWWRRELEGRLAEVLGPSAFERDRMARLLKYRGPFDDAEWTSYHADGKQIFTAYATASTPTSRHTPNNLPVEFMLTGIKPLPWTAETVVLREPAFGDAASELRLAMDVAKYGVKEANRRAAPDPWDDLTSARRDSTSSSISRGGDRRDENNGGGCRGPQVIEAYRNLVAAADDAARPAGRHDSRAGQQQLGRRRRDVADRQADRLERSAPRGHQSVAPLHRAPERAGLERDRRHRSRRLSA